MNRFARLTLGTFLLAAAVTIGCSGSSNNTGTGGTTGGGGSGGGTGGSGPDPSFMAVPPCSTEASYSTGTTVAFPAAPTDFNYNPKCLKTTVGSTVTFNGDFVMHPLGASAVRGITSGSPITDTNNGSTKAFTFPTAGFYAYWCMFHGSDADGNFMSGVIWVK
jgi:plastocyanin